MTVSHTDFPHSDPVARKQVETLTVLHLPPGCLQLGVNKYAGTSLSREATDLVGARHRCLIAGSQSWVDLVPRYKFTCQD
ncbi:hypothetical protein D9M72_476240 [compost metagenome]